MEWLHAQPRGQQRQRDPWSNPPEAWVRRTERADDAPPQEDLGTLLRLLCLVKVLLEAATEEVQNGRRKKARSLIHAAERQLTWGGTRRLLTDLKAALVFDSHDVAWSADWDSDVLFGDRPAWLNALEDFVARRHRAARDGDDPPGLADILGRRVCLDGECVGVAALARFLAWIRNAGWPARDDLRRLRCEAFITQGTPEDERTRQVDQVAWQLLRPEGSDATPVINVFSPSNWTGLRAFATELVLRLREESRALKPGVPYWPLIYLPLSRTAVEAAPGGTLSEPAQAFNRERVVEALRSALGLAERGTTGLAEDIAELQARLAQQPTLIVLDGLSISPPPLGAVFDVIRNTDWVAFVRMLVQPGARTLRSSAGAFRSRLVLLSGRPVEGLRPWRLGNSVALARLPDPSLAYALLASSRSPLPDRLAGAARVTELRRSVVDRVQRLWSAHDPFAPNAGEHGVDLQASYGLAPETVETIVSGGQHFSEREYALAWCLQESGSADRIHIAALSEPKGRLHALKLFLSGREPGETIALQFVALAINGMRFTTLQRCLAAFRRNETSEPIRQSLLKTERELERGRREGLWLRMRPLLVLAEDEAFESLDDNWRWFELQTDTNRSQRRLEEQDRQLLDLRLEAMRELFLADLVDNNGTYKPGRLISSRFLEINRILCEESLLQATSQLRGAQVLGTMPQIYASRRFIQALFHGLMTLSFTPAHPEVQQRESLHSGPHGQALPIDPGKRFKYLYSMIYRRCIENAPSWMLTRGYGRDDVRLALVSMFANPDWAREVIGALFAFQWEDRTYEMFGAFGRSGRNGFQRAFDPAAPHLDSALAADVFSSLLHAARRSEQREIVRRSNRIGAVVAARLGREELQFDFVKLHIDGLLGGERRGEARQACFDALSNLGIFWPPEAAEQGRGLLANHLNRSQFERHCLSDQAESILREGRTQTQLEAVADILARLGEAVAIDADLAHRPGPLEATVPGYASAYAIYWIADRVRSGAATIEGASVAWPMVSARAMRYYVRVSLKLGKLCSKAGLAERSAGRLQQVTWLAEMAQGFYDHARARIDVYSRHLFRLPYERVSILLLLASAARVRGALAGVVEDIDGKGSSAYLSQSLDYIEAAEQLQRVLGLNTGVLRRVLLERIKTFRAIAGDRTMRRLLAMNFDAVIQRDFALLLELSKESRYWTAVAGRLRPDPSANSSAK